MERIEGLEETCGRAVGEKEVEREKERERREKDMYTSEHETNERTVTTKVQIRIPPLKNSLRQCSRV